MQAPYQIRSAAHEAADVESGLLTRRRLLMRILHSISLLGISTTISNRSCADSVVRPAVLFYDQRMAARKKARKFVRVEYSDVPKLLSKMLIAIEKAGLSFEVMKDGKPYVHLIPDPKTK